MTALAEPSGKQRVQSIDILRGVIMLIMALDHCRDYVHFGGAANDPTNLATTTPILFFTRWITHFCAPTFVFLSGVSAFLAGTRRTKGELTTFLIKRGLWLIVVELLLMSLALTANPHYNVLVLQVLWVIGFSMILLGLLVRAPLTVVAILGGLIFFGHDILDYVQFPKDGTGFFLSRMFLTAKGTVIPLAPNYFIFDLYAVIPWTGVMLLGYVFGSLYKPSVSQPERKKILLLSGSVLIALFIILRLIDHYGDPEPWTTQRSGVYTVISFFDVSKYPPSLIYLCMTLGPALVILSLIENVQSKLAAVFIVYGNVPFFYYVLHFYFIRVINIILFFASGYTTGQIITPNSPFLFSPPGFGFNLGVVYLVWLFVISALYLPCRWFSKYKKTHKEWWLSYL